MLKVKKLTIQNFGSFGNSPATMVFDQHKMTLTRGTNGSGKSTFFLDAIIYALYGKPYRPVTKPQLINSINKSGLLVVLEFSINGNEYEIHRGMKPNVFDIFQNGELVQQSAATKDYQEFLETQILKIPEKTFKQIAILGSSTYTPFMKLAAAQRRELVESILDIEIFSKMNQVLKERVASTKEEFKTIDHKIELKTSETVSQKRIISLMEENTTNRVKELEAKNLSLKTTFEELDVVRLNINDMIAKKYESMPEFDTVEYDNFNAEWSSTTRELNALKKKIDSFCELDSCPTCLQKVTEEHTHKVTSKIELRVAELQSSLLVFEEKARAYSETQDKMYVIQEEINGLTQQIADINFKKKSLDSEIHSNSLAITNILGSCTDVQVEQDKLKELAKIALELIDRKKSLSEEKQIQDVIAQLLKDSGIKTAIVKEYLPILNQLINKYLAIFDFYVDFTMDENFNEVIKSRGRDTFSYDSFSEGEKRKIDFSILLAFRQLASIKNSAKTNILVLDEILDAALDISAKRQAQQLISSIEDSNITVISHDDTSDDAYDRTLIFDKDSNEFSFYTER